MSFARPTATNECRRPGSSRCNPATVPRWLVPSDEDAASRPRLTSTMRVREGRRRFGGRAPDLDPAHAGVHRAAPAPMGLGQRLGSYLTAGERDDGRTETIGSGRPELSAP